MGNLQASRWKYGEETVSLLAIFQYSERVMQKKSVHQSSQVEKDDDKLSKQMHTNTSILFTNA